MLGKSGKPFDKAQYFDWATRGRSTFKFEGTKLAKKRRSEGKWFCPFCFNPFHGVAIRKHKEICKS